MRKPLFGVCAFELKKRDLPPILLLILLLILVMLTLSQILYVHNGKYSRNGHNIRKLQLELREIDVNLNSLMLQNIPSVELNRRIIQNQLNIKRFTEIFKEASKHTTPHSNNTRVDVLKNKFLSQTMNESKTQPLNQTISSNVTFNRGSNMSFTNFLNNVDPPLGINDTVINQTLQEDLLRAREFSNYVDDVLYCPEVPPNLVGSVPTDVRLENLTEIGIITANPEVKPGGKWHPSKCKARHKVAIIIPYRDRLHHLIILLAHLHPILQRQQLHYTIYVVEQDGPNTFNKARIMNAAFREALKQTTWQCFVFHDVDLVPEDDRNMYSCPTQPRHMSVAIDEMDYKLAYPELVGGVLAVRTTHFEKLNGYSNLYWGWGAEDDDMAYRILHVGLKISRPPDILARYKMIPHAKRKPADWRKRAKLLYTGTRRFQYDGINSLQYKLIKTHLHPLYTHLIVDIGKPPKGF